MKPLDKKIRLFILLLGLVQGAALFIASELIAQKIWPWTEFEVSVPWSAVWIMVPLGVQLAVTNLRDKRLTNTVILMIFLVTALGVYAGASLTEQSMFVRVFPFAATIGLAWFIGLPFIQTWMKQGRFRFPYGELFFYAWSNANILISAVVFTGLFWLVLALWAGLFNVINIDFFGNLFKERFFIYTVTPLAFSAAVLLSRIQLSLSESIRKNVLNILKMLLPVVSILSITFVLALPFTGLEPLWKTGSATALMLVLQLSVVLFLNAAYQDGHGEAPHNNTLRHIIQGSLLTLPIYVGLCAYALSLRVGQYGWTADRVWAGLAIFTAGMYAVGYAVAAFARGPWMKKMEVVNTAAAIVIVAIAIVANTPPIDPYRIAVTSQIELLLKGKVEPAKFDFDYLRFDLGEKGFDAIKRLSALEGHPKASEIRALALASLAKENKWQRNRPSPSSSTPKRNPSGSVVGGPEDIAKHLKFYPKGTESDEEFLKVIFENRDEYSSCFTGYDCIVLSVDLNKDGKDERVVFKDEEAYFEEYLADFFVKLPSGWKRIGKSRAPLPLNRGKIEFFIKEGDFDTANPKWQELRIGAYRFSVGEQF